MNDINEKNLNEKDNDKEKNEMNSNDHNPNNEVKKNCGEMVMQQNDNYTEERLRKEIMKQLEKVMDPEIGYSLVDLGLIYDLKIDMKNKRIDIKMGLTTPFCPLAGPIIGSVYESVSQIEYILKNKFDVNVEYDFETIWTPERVKPELREIFGLQ